MPNETKAMDKQGNAVQGQQTAATSQAAAGSEGDKAKAPMDAGELERRIQERLEEGFKKRDALVSKWQAELDKVRSERDALTQKLAESIAVKHPKADGIKDMLNKYKDSFDAEGLKDVPKLLEDMVSVLRSETGQSLSSEVSGLKAELARQIQELRETVSTSSPEYQAEKDKIEALAEKAGIPNLQAVKIWRAVKEMLPPSPPNAAETAGAIRSETQVDATPTLPGAVMGILKGVGVNLTEAEMAELAKKQQTSWRRRVK